MVFRGEIITSLSLVLSNQVHRIYEMNYLYIYIVSYIATLALAFNMGSRYTQNRVSLRMASSRFSELKKTLNREYASFFSPWSDNFTLIM